MKYLFIFLLSVMSAFAVTPTDTDYPLGPIGGTFRIATNDNYARVTVITAGAPGEIAGLQAGDFITGSDGVAFSNTGDRFQGVARQLGWAIEQAEATDGVLSLDVIRSGTGFTSVDVIVGQNGGLSPAFPLNSPKWQAQATQSLNLLNAKLLEDSNVSYPTGWLGLSLLGSPNWNDTTGEKPYRLGINKVYHYYKDLIERATYRPVEQRLFDGTDNPNHVGFSVVGLENWYIGLGTMFLAEYYSKTLENPPTPQNIEDLALLQMAAEKIANRIQWWHQPQTSSSLSYTTLRPGIVGHGGVTGDYMHYSFGGGINIVGVHLSGGLAMAKNAGVDMNVAPVDGRYFGYNPLLFDDDPDNDPDGLFLPAGLTISDGGKKVAINGTIKDFLPTSTTHPELAEFVDELDTRQPTLDEKLEIMWSYYKRSQSNGTGHINYAPGTGALNDSFGRTMGAFFPARQMQKGGTIFTDNPDDGNLSRSDSLTRYNLLKSYLKNQYDRALDIHAVNMQGPTFFMLSQSGLETRERQHFLDNWRFYYNFMRQPDGSSAFFRGRLYGGTSREKLYSDEIHFALAQAVASGGLNLVDGYDSSNQRLVDFSKVPHLEWIDFSTRTIKTRQANLALDLEVTDGSGAPTSDYTAAWTGPPEVNFSSSDTLDTTITTATPGVFDLMLTVQSGDGSTTEEPIRVTLLPDCGPDYLSGVAEYKVYTDIGGTAVSDLTNNSKFPDSPDSTAFLSSLNGVQDGNDFGATLTTLIIPPETGTYQFYLVTDDQGSLLFNPNGEEAAGAVEIASVPSWASSGQWTKFPEQKSIEFTLTAGQKYYLQGLMKESGGAQPFEIGWTTPSNSEIEIIGSGFLAFPKDATPAAITLQPADVTTTIGETVTFTVEVEGPEPRLFQWQLNGENFGPTQTSPSLEISNTSAYLGGQWQLIFTSGNNVIESDTVTLTFSDVGQLATGGLWQEVYNNIGGSSVASLTENSKYPASPDSSGPITESFVGSMGDDYGQRWTGWLVPSETARFRFYGAADDDLSLRLSPTEYSCHLKEILTITSYTGERNFDQRAPSGWFELEAGQRYAIELLHKEGGGGDHAAISWQKEGDPVPADGSNGIPAANLQYRTGGPDLEEICPPFATNDDLVTIAGETILIEALRNDLDNDLPGLSIASVSTPAIGTATISADEKSIIFNSLDTDSGIVTFTYTIKDSDDLMDQASVTVDIRSLSSGLALHYEFEDLTSGAIDSTGNTANGTIGGTIDECPDQIFGSAYLVDASNDTVTLDPTVLDNISDEITVSFWMNPSSFGRNDVKILEAANTVDGTTPLNFHYPWFTQAFIDSDDDDSTDGVRDRIIQYSGIDRAAMLDRWSHVVFTKNATTGIARFYIDNEILLQGNNLTEPIGTTDRFRFGGFRFFRGKLDDLRLYNRALAEEEIAALFNLPAKPTVSLTAAPGFVMENAGTPVTYTLTRTGTLADNLPVSLQITGQADNGIDYQTLASVVTIPAGISEVTFDMLPIDDQFGESTEAVNIRLVADDSYTIGETDPLVSIGNDDLPRLDVFILDPKTSTLRFRFSPETQLATDPELQWSTSLLLNSWTPFEGTATDIGNEIKEHTLPTEPGFPIDPKSLFFRWKVE